MTDMRRLGKLTKMDPPFLRCTLTAERGRKIGWKPRYPPEHIIEDAENEVQLILDNL
jgi:hypothetical protein